MNTNNPLNNADISKWRRIYQRLTWFIRRAQNP